MKNKEYNIFVQTSDNKFYTYDEFMKNKFEINIENNEFLNDEVLQVFAPNLIKARKERVKTYELVKDRQKKLDIALVKLYSKI